MNSELNTQGPTEKQMKSVEKAIEYFKNGKMVIIVDDEGRENEGDIALPAQDCKPEDINFMATIARGLICTPLDGSIIDKLDLEPMVTQNTESMGTAFTVSVDASNDIESGISAKDRANTVEKLSNPKSEKTDFVKPGHIFPLRYQKGGVLVRAGHTEGSVDISKLANKNPSGVICEIMSDNGKMAKGKELIEFANIHKLKIGRIDDLIAYRLKVEKLVKLKKTDSIKIQNQKYKIKVFENTLDGSENFALIKGKIIPGKKIRVRVISSNLVQNYLMGKKFPDLFNKTIKYFKNFNNCVLVFIKDTNLKSVTQTLSVFKSNKNYKKSDQMIRNYGIGAQIIKSLNITKMILVTRSPKKVVSLEGFGIKIIKQEIIK